MHPRLPRNPRLARSPCGGTIIYSYSRLRPTPSSSHCPIVAASLHLRIGPVRAMPLTGNSSCHWSCVEIAAHAELNRRRELFFSSGSNNRQIHSRLGISWFIEIFVVECVDFCVCLHHLTLIVSSQNRFNRNSDSTLRVCFVRKCHDRSGPACPGVQHWPSSLSPNGRVSWARWCCTHLRNILTCHHECSRVWLNFFGFGHVQRQPLPHRHPIPPSQHAMRRRIPINILTYKFVS